MERKRKYWLILHGLLMIYSTTSVFGKLASGEDFLGYKFCIYYCIIIVLLVVYAVGWQQIIKKLPLTTAFANKAITVVWGIIWGHMFFGESITLGKIVGALIVISGVVLYMISDEGKNDGK